jgi:hypothetical protein
VSGTSKYCLLTALTLVLFLPMRSAHADAPTVATAPQPESIIDQLAATIPHWTKPHHVLLYVDPGSTDATTASAAPAQQTDQSPEALYTPEDVAFANGLGMTWSGGTLAIVPMQMTVLNTSQSLFDLPLDEIVAVDPLPSLLKSLSSDQFNTLKTSGLSMSDLDSDQQTLFRDLLPDPLQEVESSAQQPERTQHDYGLSGEASAAFDTQFQADTDAFNKQIIDVPVDEVTSEARLHAYVNLAYSSNGNGSTGWSYEDDRSSYTGALKIVPTNEFVTDKLTPIGQKLQDLLTANVPNVSKPSDIDYRSPALTANVSLSGVKTVDDLVAAIAKATGLELYSDPSYGPRVAYLAGDIADGEPGSQLLEALALCVCGTWRKVGPAYVLTDDLEGLGARQQFLDDVGNSWINRFIALDTNCGHMLDGVNWISTMSTFPGDDCALSGDQRKTLFGDNSDTANTTWGDLPSQLQNDLAMQMNYQNTDNRDDPAGTSAALESIPPNTPITVTATVKLAIEIPGAGIMLLSEYTPGPNDQPPLPPSKIVLDTEKVRAVLCAPQTGQEARKTVDLLPQFGLNTIIVDVFNNGRTFFNNSAIVPESPEASDVLTATLAEAKSKNIAVYAAIDTFCWRKDGDLAQPHVWPAQVQPALTLFDLPTDTAGQLLQSEKAFFPLSGEPYQEHQVDETADRWVDPSDPYVQQVLPILVKDLASVPGLSGIIFQDTAPPGYYGQYDPFTLDTGYSQENRLSFLRNNHADPIDMQSHPHAEIFAQNAFEWLDIGVPGFHKYSGGRDKWNKFRQDIDLSVLMTCYSAAKGVNPALPLMMRERVSGATIDQWAEPQKVDQMSYLSPANIFSYINSKSMFVIPFALMLPREKSIPDAISQFSSDCGRGAEGGVVFDLENGGFSQSVPTLLSELQPYLATDGK